MIWEILIPILIVLPAVFFINPVKRVDDSEKTNKEEA